MTYPTHTVRILLATACLVAAGCNSGSRTSTANATTAPATSNVTTAPANSTTTTAPTTSNAPTTTTAINWDTPFAATPAIQNDSFFALHPLPSGEVLAGSTTGVVRRIDVAAGTEMNEGSYGAVSSFAERTGGTIYLATSNSFFMGGGLGQVLERDAQGNWTVSLDHPLGGATIVAMGDTLYAFASEFGASTDATVSTLAGNNGVWQQDVATFPTCQLNKAVVWRNEVWVAGSDNNQVSGLPKLFRGTAATFTDASAGIPDGRNGNNQLEFSTDLRVINGELYLATAVIDTLTGNVVAGSLNRTNDGTTWTVVKSYVNDCPLSLALFEGGVVAGLVSGGLDVTNNLGQIVVDAGVPASTGIMSLLPLNATTLLAGARGATGAELFRRETVTTTTGGGGTTPPPAPTTSYVTDVKPILQGNCAACHSNPNNPGFTAYPLGFTDDTADHTATVARVDMATPENSLLLTKARGVAHGGGAILTQGAADYNAIVQWIAAGAPR